MFAVVRSLTSASPSGRNATPHGTARFVATSRGSPSVGRPCGDEDLSSEGVVLGDALEVAGAGVVEAVVIVRDQPPHCKQHRNDCHTDSDR